MKAVSKLDESESVSSCKLTVQWWLLNFKINIQILGDLINLNTDDGNHDDITHHKYYKGIADKADEEDDSERNGNHIEGQDTYHHLQ